MVRFHDPEPFGSEPDDAQIKLDETWSKSNHFFF